jgi:hypothetical protein
MMWLHFCSFILKAIKNWYLILVIYWNLLVLILSHSMFGQTFCSLVRRTEIFDGEREECKNRNQLPFLNSGVGRRCWRQSLLIKKIVVLGGGCWRARARSLGKVVWLASDDIGQGTLLLSLILSSSTLSWLQPLGD